MKYTSPSSLLSGDYNYIYYIHLFILYVFALACGALYDSAFTEEVSTAQPPH